VALRLATAARAFCGRLPPHFALMMVLDVVTAGLV
jgi:hypothetical protein